MNILSRSITKPTKKATLAIAGLVALGALVIYSSWRTQNQFEEGKRAYAANEFSRAEDLFRESIKEEVAEEPKQATKSSWLALALKEQKKYVEAEALYLKLIERDKRVFGDLHFETIVDKQMLGDLYRSQGELEKAIAIYSQVIAAQNHLKGQDKQIIAIALNNLARLEQSRKNFAQARVLFEQSIELNQQLFGEDAESTQLVRRNLAALNKVMN